MDKYRISAEAKLNVHSELEEGGRPEAPNFLATPRNTVVTEGSQVTLECAANGHPRPEITWLKDGTTIDLEWVTCFFFFWFISAVPVSHELPFYNFFLFFTFFCGWQSFGQQIPSRRIRQLTDRCGHGSGRGRLPVPGGEHGGLCRRHGPIGSPGAAALRDSPAQHNFTRERRRRARVPTLRTARTHRPVDQKRRAHHRKRILPGNFITAMR